jgi:3-methylcrotonyl-CoA carboxylase alpha subunit
MFKSVLIANRGEIACRIARTARRLGIRTVAVYSAADRDARHVRQADEAVAIGPSPAAESYLVVERVLDAARRAGAAAVHPGYGFLSESSAFARAVREAGLTFVGPSPEAMELMGGKDTAKEVMGRAGVPLVPGYHGADQSDARLQDEAGQIGPPLLIKAAAGGGGKGMRRVDEMAAFADALASCRREAGSAFGDDRMLLERLIERPRHVEVQVFADRHGNAVHLFERDCTLQRRHQKVIEEAPAPDLPADLRDALGRAAVQAALAAAYEGAGTVEFLLAPDGRFYFIEMNTRLQVEHPVTEAITGQDLVEWQLRVAAGEPLPLHQDEVRARGHAVEARLYAEDPEKGFLPSTGRLRTLRLPDAMPGIRVDTGVVEGDAVTPFYDPMIAKVIAHGPDRDRALDLLARALDAAAVEGPATNLAFLRRAVRAEPFRGLAIDTGWLDREGGLPDRARRARTRGSGAGRNGAPAVPRAARRRARRGLGRPRLALAPHRRLADEPRLVARLPAERRGRGGDCPLRRRSGGPQGRGGRGDLRRRLPRGRRRLRPRRGGARRRVLSGWATVGRERVTLVRDGRTLVLGLPDVTAPAAEESDAGALLAAPMPGKVTRLLVATGDRAAAGQTLAILEAMKMEHRFEAPREGVVTAVHVREGEQVEEGTILLDLSAAEPPP